MFDNPFDHLTDTIRFTCSTLRLSRTESILPLPAPRTPLRLMQTRDISTMQPPKQSKFAIHRSFESRITLSWGAKERDEWLLLHHSNCFYSRNLAIGGRDASDCKEFTMEVTRQGFLKEFSSFWKNARGWLIKIWGDEYFNQRTKSSFLSFCLITVSLFSNLFHFYFYSENIRSKRKDKISYCFSPNFNDKSQRYFEKVVEKSYRNWFLKLVPIVGRYFEPFSNFRKAMKSDFNIFYWLTVERFWNLSQIYF